MDETTAADDFMFTALNVPTMLALTPKGVFPEQAPDGTLPAYTVFSPRPTFDWTTNDRERVATVIAYDVRAIFERNCGEADQAKALIDSLIHDKHVVQNGYRIDSRRTAPLVNLTDPMGRTYRFAGGRYEVIVRPASLYS